MTVWSNIRFRYVLLTTTAALFSASIWLTACQSSVDLPADVAAAQTTLPDQVDYNLHVKPILSDRCFACHGPDQTKQKAGLRLDTPDGAYQALAKSGHTAVVPGKPGNSALVQRILSTDPDEMMPTPESNLSLNAEEKAVLVRWVEQGGQYKEHWSLIAPTMPEVPEVKDGGWAKNNIDWFVLARQASLKLGHAGEADKATLLRRVSLDLTGLPPSASEVDAFLADTAPNAYEKVVNRLLSSPHYGEYQAVAWLDVARYADTHGYQDDGPRTVWPYRDWVIRAFNRNLSFDRFITWQLAGDLLPHPNKDMLVATAFNRNHQQSQEGGIVPEEYQAEYLADRTATFGKAMLGLTVECARCHDHKYDPISQKDYYALGAFFAQNNEYGQIPYNGEPAPHLTLPTPDAEAKLKFIRETIRSADQQQTADLNTGAKERFAAWLAQVKHDPAKATLPADQDLAIYIPFDQSKDVPADQNKEAKKKRQKTEHSAETKKNPQPPVVRMRRLYLNQVNDTLPLEMQGDLDAKIPFVKSPVGQGVKLIGESFLQMKGVGGFDTWKGQNNHGPNPPGWYERNQPFTVSIWVNVQDPKLKGPLFNRSLGPFNGFRGYECVRLEDGRLAFRFSNVWPDDALDVETFAKLPLNRWTHLTVAYDGSGRAAGLHLYANGQTVRTRAVTDHLTQSTIWGKDKTNWGAGTPNFSIGQRHDYNFKGYAVDELRVYDRKLTPLEVRSLFTQRDELRAALRRLSTMSAQPDARMLAELFDYYLTNVDQPVQERRLARQQQLGEETQILNDQIDVMVMRERKYPRPTYLLKRGAYDAPGERVQPAVLHRLEPIPDGIPKNRLSLAQWLFTPENPLFSRVIVNRMWQHFFGQGLAKSADDFGNQGAMPSHPELLDYLAVRFRDGWPLPGTGQPGSRWNVKAMHKLIVMSATYRQASAVGEKQREADPDNTYLTRGSSYRMSAEQVRDNALAASGLLNQRIGGPSVHPYQPNGIWEALATRNATHYVQSHGDSLYRRSMYTIWKRSAPPPMMLNFDASERYACMVKRQKTSTPLQALVTLNDPQFVEAARVLAQRALGRGDRGDKLVNDAFKAIISRPARPLEMQLMKQLYADELTDFQKNPQQAQVLLSVGEYPVDPKLNPAELAAWTVVASTLMNFDEAIIKR